MSKKEKERMDTRAEESVESWGARLALQPSFNAATVIQPYTGKMLGKEPDINVLIEELRGSSEAVQNGDLSRLEAMLVSQATTLQSLFTSLARRAQVQQSQRNLEAFLALALKSQAQSRATIQAVVELKYPRQVAIVKQANISHGPQQINNGSGSSHATRAEENKAQQNKLLEDQSHGCTRLDTATKTEAGTGYQTLETLDPVDRAKKQRRQR